MIQMLNFGCSIFSGSLYATFDPQYYTVSQFWRTTIGSLYYTIVFNIHAELLIVEHLCNILLSSPVSEPADINRK